MFRRLARRTAVTAALSAPPARLKSSPSFSKIQQEPLFPGKYRQVTQFEGEHVYEYGKHTWTLARESTALSVIPAGTLLAYMATWFPWCPILPLEVQGAYMLVLFAVSRAVARGRANHIRRDLTSRHVVLTGWSSGIGLQTAAQLAGMGADLSLLGRDSPHAEKALQYIESCAVRKEGTADVPPQRIQKVKLDLADFIAVRDYCKRARQGGEGVDLLVNCAGLIHEKQVSTRFGDDEQLAANYLGPYLLTEGLLPLVQRAHGRIVYVSCSAHVSVAGRIVNTYLSGRGVWSPRVANRFDGLEQYGFTKLGNIYHAQDLAVRSYPPPARQRLSARLTALKDPKLQPGTAAPTAAEAALAADREPSYTSCACAPGGVMTRLYRHAPLQRFVFTYLKPLLLLIMRTPHEGSQTVLNCCLRDELRNGGYYMNCAYKPTGLSQTACDVGERAQVMAWTRKKMRPYMKWE